VGVVPQNPFPVVGVGASAGGLDALTQLIAALPNHPGLAVVVIQHLDPHYDSRLVDLLQPHTALPIVEARHGVRVEADRVFVIQPNTSVAIVDGVLSVTPRPDDRRPHYPIDHFLRSLAEVQGPLGIAAILSGTGSDGTLGVFEVKAAGGMTFAQDNHTAQYPSMPQSAVASGAIDLVLPPREIATRLASLPHDPRLVADRSGLAEASADAEDFHQVITALRRTSGVDFSQYRETTIRRRTARRMLLRGIRGIADYVRLLERDRSEADALYRDVLINVTSFFRDPKMFEDLKRDVFPALLETGSDAQPIRVWVPGCSTGQEAYSIAIALLEFLEASRSPRLIQIFATDLGDASALDRARAGLYPESIEAEVSPDRLKRFFFKEDRGYRIQKHVREMCVFARQNLTVDPPFSRVDLVTCRNVLIYMSSALQERLLPVFHFALNPDGFMVLGLAETVGSFGDLFELVNSTHKIYRKRNAAPRPQLAFMGEEWLAGATPRRENIVGQPPVDFQREADRLIVGRYAPPSVLVDERLQIQHYRGRTAQFLEAPAGQPTTSILRMAKPGLATELRSALTEAGATRAPVVRDHLHVKDGDADVEFTLRILPVGHPRSTEICLLVLFELTNLPVWSADAAAGYDAPPGTDAERDAAWLRTELASTRQYLQALIEQQDVATQELRAAHEEVLSSNEELQSTNEELETAKEELQSANEELTTVNEQFQTRNRELAALTDDLSNFIGSADVPMVTVDRDLMIRRLTPAARKAFNLRETDVGRSIEHIKFSLAVDRIGESIVSVIETGQPWERDVRDDQERWWVVRVQPFRTADHRVDGATIVAMDVDLIRRAHDLAEARDYALAIVHTVREPLVVLDAECRVGLANDAFYKLFDTTGDQMEGRSLWDSEHVVWTDPDLRRVIGLACAGKHAIVNLEISRHLPGRGDRTLIFNARGIVRSDRPNLLLLSIEDVTESRAAESLRVDADALRLVDRRKDEFLGILAHELRNPLAPMRFALELMRRPGENAGENTKAREVLERQVAHLVRLIDDLLDVSRIRQGKIELRKEAATLSDVVRDAIEVCQPATLAAGHELTVSLPSDSITLHADPVRLTQIIVNLLNNAIKFTPRGGYIWLIAEVTSDASDRRNQVRIRVRDTGIGIASEQRARVFDMFMQGDRSLERSREGLGVGLTLVRSLVGLHGGSVEVRSDGPHTGSEFIVCLPLDPAVQPVPAKPNHAKARRPNRSLKILVADDHTDGREMLTYFLQSQGHEVAAAADGPTALSLADQFRPDVAILDIGMPGMDGYTVARRLRQSPGGDQVALVALSGLGQPGDKARAAEAGFRRHFTKPVDIPALVAFLAAADVRSRP
jgi:two-component system CheB/CheR fusion protein